MTTPNESLAPEPTPEPACVANPIDHQASTLGRIEGLVEAWRTRSPWLLSDSDSVASLNEAQKRRLRELFECFRPAWVVNVMAYPYPLCEKELLVALAQL